MTGIRARVRRFATANGPTYPPCADTEGARTSTRSTLVSFPPRRRPSPAPTPAHAPEKVVEAAHVALHQTWATPGDQTPTGTGCTDCLPDLTDLVTALWKQARATGSVPGWACVQASRTLHNAWSASPIPTDDDSVCQDCMGDVTAIVDGILNATRAAA